MITEPWLAELLAIRHQAALRCGLSRYPGREVMASESRERAGRMPGPPQTWRERLAEREGLRPITTAAREPVTLEECQQW